MPGPLVFLEDYLSQPDFKVALRARAKDFRSEHGFPVDCDEVAVTIFKT